MHVHTVEELYETPQNVLSILVRNPLTHNERDTGKPYVDYEIVTEVRSPPPPLIRGLLHH